MNVRNVQRASQPIVANHPSEAIDRLSFSRIKCKRLDETIRLHSSLSAEIPHTIAHTVYHVNVGRCFSLFSVSFDCQTMTIRRGRLCKVARFITRHYVQTLDFIASDLQIGRVVLGAAIRCLIGMSQANLYIIVNSMCSINRNSIQPIADSRNVLRFGSELTINHVSWDKTRKFSRMMSTTRS